jgi:hypothetical protein
MAAPITLAMPLVENVGTNFRVDLGKDYGHFTFREGFETEQMYEYGHGSFFVRDKFVYFVIQGRYVPPISRLLSLFVVGIIGVHQDRLLEKGCQ